MAHNYIPKNETTVFKIRSNGSSKILTFIAGLHVTNDGQFFDFLKNIFSFSKPEMLLVECPYTTSTTALRKSSKYEIMDEIAYMTRLAIEHGAKVNGMDEAYIRLRFLSPIEQETKRNERMIRRCISTLQKHDRILALAGHKHIREIRESLKNRIETAYGDVKVELLGDSATC